MRAEVCTNIRCLALHVRPTGAPAPAVCTRCGQPFPRVAPRTGRWAVPPRRPWPARYATALERDERDAGGAA